MSLSRSQRCSKERLAVEGTAAFAQVVLLPLCFITFAGIRQRNLLDSEGEVTLNHNGRVSFATNLNHMKCLALHAMDRVAEGHRRWHI